MKTIKIKYVDMWEGFNPETFLFTTILREKFQVEFSDAPEYLFYSCFGYEHLKYTDCIKICYMGENLAPDFNLCDYAVTHEKMEYGDRHFWFPTGLPEATRPELYNRQDRDPGKENRTRFCSFVYSNGNANPFREQLYQIINGYRPVDGGGKLHHTVDIPAIQGANRFQERIAFEKNYKFSIACENDSHPGYCTEKILISFIAGTIPIYWGDPLVKTLYNEKAFLYVSDYKTPEELIAAIRRIDEDEQAYTAMLREPVFVPGWSYAAMEQGLREFLWNIAQQPKEKAYRRCRIMYGKEYDATLNRWHDAWEKTRRGLWRRLLKI